MTDRFSVIPLPRLLQIILNQYKSKQCIFGVNEELFFNSAQNQDLRIHRFGKLLETPIGVAAGPQTQLAQNIVASWLCGARFIELKTIQTLDELEVSKPCIDMQDEGYNCEWSQELKIVQSFDQYLDAWIIIHILRDLMNHDATAEPGLIFNMSVGYDLKGIMQQNVQWFFRKMADASVELNAKLEAVKSIYPNIVNLNINPCISDNITLSTMHGCPADEIEAIAAYLIEEKKLHTAIKLNPTLLGKEELNKIIRQSGFETQVPDLAFEHDLKYVDALPMINNLKKKALQNGLQFSVKLTNTLESKNHKEVFSPAEEMMYMSGKALHPVSILVAAKLQDDFNGKLDISFSGGADAFNVADIVKSGLAPVTICTDLLKPGGYGRLNQYIENLSGIITGNSSVTHVYLNAYAKVVKNSEVYKKEGLKDPSIKTERILGAFDCIHAPCVDTCPTNQGIPDYLYYTSKGEFKKAADIILETNPFPHTTGMVCDHLCQTKCTRINYDSSLLIREIKRFVAENHMDKDFSEKEKTGKNRLTVSVIGAGPSGLSCAYFLAKTGFTIDVYEAKSKSGGMVSGAIPSFRLTDEAIDIDIQTILDLGVHIHYDFEVNNKTFERIRRQSDFIFIGTGARVSKKPDLPGMDSKGILDPLDFLFRAKQSVESGIGKNVVIIGGGNTAMDAARTAYRLVGKGGKVTIVYRRTIKQMPADLGEIKAVLEEGVEVIELVAPLQINAVEGKVNSLSCIKMKLGEKDSSGRARPIAIPGSEFDIEADTLIPAIGQEVDIDFIPTDQLSTNKNSYQTKAPGVFIGGDALRGASTAINAIGDGRKAAAEIIREAGIESLVIPNGQRQHEDARTLMLRKARRIPAQTVKETSLDDRRNFQLVSSSLTEEEAIKEASRCLLCDEICDICTTVCPNLAFHSYEVKPVTFSLQKIISTKTGLEVIDGEDFKIDQRHQILHIADWCNKCGNCDTFCPSAGAPYLEKPHLYLNRTEFEKEKDGYFLETNGEHNSLFLKKGDDQYILRSYDDYLFFESPFFSARIELKTLRLIELVDVKKANFEQEFRQAAEMKIILQGALDFFVDE